MIRRTSVLACALIGSLFLANAATAARREDPFARTWKSTLVPSGNPVGKAHRQTLKLQNERGKLGGTITVGRTATPVADVRVRDTSIAFRVKVEDTHTESVYRGTLSDGEIHGTVTVHHDNEVFTYDWTAQPAR